MLMQQDRSLSRQDLIVGSVDRLTPSGHKHLLPAEEGDLAELASDTAMVQIWGQKSCQAQVFPGGHSQVLSALQTDVPGPPACPPGAATNWPQLLAAADSAHE